MVSSNKILTVSYGTFSCTLEGFDNSFDTMKAIAEYFRDLAQDDRYFGAEPPTPDAEMLARIAEREIERRVEARFEQGNLVLRPTDDAETPHGDVAPEQSPGAALVNATAGLAATDLAVADTSEDETSDEVVTEEDVASDEIEDVAAEDVVTEDSEVDGITLDLSDIDLAEPHMDDVAIGIEEIEEQDVLQDTANEDASVEDLVADLQEEASADTTPLSLVEGVEEPTAELVEHAPEITDSVADKLQRIRAVVASKAQEEPEYIEDEHAMSGPDGDGIDENDAIDVDGDIPGFDDEPEIAAEVEEDVTATDEDSDNLFADTIAAIVNDEIDAEVEDEDDALLSELPEEDVSEAADLTDTEAELETLRAKIALLEAQAASIDEAAETTAPDMDVLDVDELDDEDPIAAESDFEELETDELDANEPELEAQDVEELAAEEEAPFVLEDAVSDAEDEAEDDAQPIVARVNKAKRADVEAALAAGEIEEYDEDDTSEAVSETAEVPGADDSTLTPEQEAELARELADLHAEIEDDDDWKFEVSEDTSEEDLSEDVADEDEDEDDAIAEATGENFDEDEADASIRKAVKLTSPGRAMLTDTSIEEDDQSVERLIGQTETEMDEPEGNRRRSAIAHLRAAVAATKADRLLGGLRKKAEEEEEPYREDLADAVRPRRPKVSEARSERPAPVRPAPLKLVAEQRVDVEEAAEDVQPVRPRRVMRADPVDAPEDVAGDDTGFAEFAEDQGAHTLPELLEAAASYMSFVEGRDQFSRPQLMTKLHQAEGSASSREERLRSFGQLLREGKIEKKGGGRFTASDNIGYKPDERAAG